MSKPQRGDIRQGGGDLLLLVLSLNEEDGYEWCNVMYVHDAIDVATSSDLVMSTESPSFTMLDSALTKRVWVVETDLYSTCDLSLIGDLVGVIGQHELDCLNEHWSSRQRYPEITSEYHYSGAPFVGETLEEVKLDPRWEYKVKRGDDIRGRQRKSLEKLLD